MATVCVFAPNLFHALETIGFYFGSSGFDVVFATVQNGDDRSEHPWSLQRVRQTQEVRSISDNPGRYDLLIADAFMDVKYSGDLVRWSSHADQRAFLFPHDGTTFKRRGGHLLRYWPNSLTARTAIFIGDRRLTIDTISPAFQRRVFYPPYIHPQLLADEPLRQVFADFSTIEDRHFSIGFLGNRNPPERERILAECRRAVDQTDARALWGVYGDDEHHKAFSPQEYIGALGKMDFCICPGGWGGNWTHRVVESLCRGAIPILPDPHLYGLGLQDSKTCLTVGGDDWNAVVSRALRLPHSTIQEMRANVLALRDDMLTPSAASRRFSEQFGIAP